MIEPHSFVPRKTDDAFYAIANTAAQELWNSLYTGGTHDDIKRFLNTGTPTTRVRNSGRACFDQGEG